jgi:hypothetical protein
MSEAADTAREQCALHERSIFQLLTLNWLLSAPMKPAGVGS